MNTEMVSLISSLGTLATVLIAVLKLAHRFGVLEAKVEKAMKDIDHSHIKIRDIERYLREK